jgi:uncharacterized protein YxjI
MHMFPLKLSFKIAALAPQIYVRDASGNEILYVRQKLLKLKDKIRVFADSSQTNQLYEIDADRVLDWSARFTFTDTQGRVLGAVGGLGAKSLWRATYEVADAAGRQIFLIEEENPWVKVLDRLLEEVPILGMFTGFFFNPRYDVKRTDTGQIALRLSKRRSLLGSEFEITNEAGQLADDEEVAVVLAVLIMTLHERHRG